MGDVFDFLTDSFTRFSYQAFVKFIDEKCEEKEVFQTVMNAARTTEVYDYQKEKASYLPSRFPQKLSPKIQSKKRPQKLVFQSANKKKAKNI